MKLQLTGKATQLLAYMLYNPYRLPLTACPPSAQGARGLLPFRAKSRKDRAALRRLRKSWFEKNIKPDTYDKQGNPEYKEEQILQPLNTSLTQCYVDLIKDEMMKHYENIGNLVEWNDAYEELLSALEGKDLPDDNPFESKEESKEEETDGGENSDES